MEVLQCDGCDFRAESPDELKTHIQDVHTAFLQPEVPESQESPGRSRSNSSNSLSHTEDDDSTSGHYNTLHKQTGLVSFNKDLGHFSGSQEDQAPPQKTLNRTTQFFQCKFCVRYFRSSSLLREHTKKVHGSATQARNESPSKTFKLSDSAGAETVFSCKFCTYKSPQRAQLLKHQKMHHKDGQHGLHSLLEAEVVDVESDISSEGQCEEYPDHHVLESMTKPQSRGGFNCEWCGFQTLQRQQLADHIMKKHRNMVKIMASLQQPKIQDGSAGSSKSDSASSRRSTPNSPLNMNDLASSEGTSVNALPVKGTSSQSSLKVSSGFQYSQLTAKIPNSTGSSILSERSTFNVSDVSRSGLEMDVNMLNDSRSSSDEEPGEPEVSVEDSTKLLLSEEDNDLLETKGVPFRRYMNHFQCPFCSFLTRHRRSISRHIENIHLSGKATVYKCDECPFLCTNPLKLDSHKQCHAGSSEWDTMDLTHDGHAEPSENGGTISAKLNGKKSNASEEHQGPHRCSLCSFSTMTLKGLRVHQQHKHSYCDGTQLMAQDGSPNEQQDSESESYNSSSFVQKTQTSILGFSNKKHLIGKTARKSINDLPLDLSPVKKRTRIDEIANNLQSKISQSQQHEDVINLEEMDDDGEENGNHIDSSDIQTQHFMLNTQHFRKSGGVGKRKRSLQSKLASRNLPVQLTISDDEDHFSASMDASDSHVQNSQDGTDFSEDHGNLFYCKHCEYHNKSARSVSTHYQRMHPYIKFSFRYILDPEDQSAVFRCLECFIEYNNFNDLHQHYMTHHPEASNVLNFNQPDLVYMCRFCSYTSPNVRSLMPHYQRMHPSVKINNAMIFSSYMVDQPHKGSAESQTLREILNSGPKSFSSTSSGSRSSSSPALKSLSKTQDSNAEAEGFHDGLSSNMVVYDCDICSFSSPNMHSVLVHYQKKHPEQKASYFRIQKTMRVVSMDKARASSGYSISSSHKASSETPALGLDEDVFYCKHCVYNNRSVVGVLVHYQKRHPEIKVTAKYIKHAPPTPGLLKLMDELQIAPPRQFLKQFNNNGLDESGNSNTKGTCEKGESEMLFFCQHCDYGNRTVKGVLIHYQKKHRDVKANADLVRRHTAVVRSQRERAQMTQAGTSTSAAPEVEKSRSLRSLKCRHCVYSSPYVYALKKHLKKDHPTVKATAMTILHWAFQDGVLEAGYHCEWCIYSHAEPSGLLMHYQRRHPEHNVDYTYMASKLWAGPETSTTNRQSGNLEAKHYQCRDCAFEACTIWDITNHYQAVHPWAVKGDETILIDIIKGNQASDSSLSPALVSGSAHFSSQLQEDIGIEVSRPTMDRQSNLSSISNNPYQCTVCLSEYNSLHGLLTHYGKKHPGMKVKAADFAQEADINPSSVYKCRHCPYVNSRIHGVLTHYQKRHPSIKVTAEDFADDVEQVNDILSEGDEKSKTQRQGYGAYRCKMCPYTHGTFEKLKIHYEKYHNQPVTDIFKVATIQSIATRDDSIAECSSSNVTEVAEVSEVAENAKSDKHAVFKCQLCKYFCPTRKGIARHYRIKHNNVRAQPEGKNNVFKCALCSYTNPIRKGLAAHYQKRHDIDAYYTHCLAASKTVSEKPKVTVPLASDTDAPVMSEELRLAVDRRKCSLCSFQAFSRKSIVSHYIKRHPGVFPKKQPSSKLGRYFTVMYSTEAEKEPSTEGMETVDVKDEVETETDLNWLPFRCLKCFKLSFSDPDLLVGHYNECHCKDLRRDFITSSSEGPAEGGSDELYQCTHCEVKFPTLPELALHLIKHNEDFQKKAKRLERRKQLQIRQKTSEQPDSRNDSKVDVTGQTPVGYRCNFCVEVHPTLRAICNHLRKHVQYGEAKDGQLKQEAAEMPVSSPVEGVSNGCVGDGLAMDAEGPVEPEKVPEVSGHQCSMCSRMFMSMQGLRSHERSHSAVALVNRSHKYNCQFCQFSSAFRHNLDRHIQSHHGHQKPFRCKLCPFKFSYLSRLKSHLHKAHPGEHGYRCVSCPFTSVSVVQLKEHSLQKHGQTLTLPRLRAGAAVRTPRTPPHSPDSPEHSDSVMYLESADVQQQLSHYQLAPRGQSDGSCSPPPPPTPDGSAPVNRPDAILTCEFCEFSSGYMQSLRRHYRDRHGGKKLFKCKDCTFFTCHKSTFTLHVEGGHASIPDEPPKDLRCPFCLYHTKYKSSMIDHVVLHREERVVPLEVSRSKLSRHLEGLVFRCSSCTFTSSSELNLQQHLLKHQELKPYHCELCYYNSSRLHQLESHLHHEHKVVRNFELVGRVNLDHLELQQEQMKDVSGSEEEQEEEEEDEEASEVQQEESSSGPESAGVPVPESPGDEKRLPCEFCGRTFTLTAEWERHVLRHGMTVNGGKTDSSPASTSSLIGPVTVTELVLDQSVSAEDPSVQSESPIEMEVDEETKNDP